MVLMSGIQNKDFVFITKTEPDAGTASIPTCYRPRPSDICQDSCDENDYEWTNGISGYSINSFVTISVFQCAVSEAQGESGGFSVEAKISHSFEF